MMADLEFDCIAAIPYAALPIGTAVALTIDVPLIYPRREVKDYGTGVEIEGVFEVGNTAVVLDDLVTTGESKFETINILKVGGLLVRDVVVLIDREQGAEEVLASHGYSLHSAFTILELLDEWKSSDSIDLDQYSAVMNYLSAPS
jgi:uridine monophosphate synthetase